MSHLTDEKSIAHAERARMDEVLAPSIDGGTRASIWDASEQILAHGPPGVAGDGLTTGLALGYVQSGNTTTMMALIADAADRGYRVIVALLGVTNLLLDQNADRIEDSVGISRIDYRWVAMRNPKGVQASRQVGEWLDRDRVLLLPVLKHAGRIDALAEVLRRAGATSLPTLIIDDEADQASLNTTPKQDVASKTNAAVVRLKDHQEQHLFIQFTATPYAPLLLEPDDSLKPEFVTFLHPGPGYTGGREFFVENADKVIRRIPPGDEQTSRAKPTMLPSSLVDALANFFAGSAMLLGKGLVQPPISMLVHSTHSTEVQGIYEFLIKREIKRWATLLSEGDEVPRAITEERRSHRGGFGANGRPGVPDTPALRAPRSDRLARQLRERPKAHRLEVTPIHVLVGGNKLDRGFTVEGLTVTYMNRPASNQIDTLEQRARAFGYRQDLLPYCQFFATARTLKVLREIVFTEYDLRAMLRDHLDQGGSVDTWAKDVGLMLPTGTKPSRDAVISAVGVFNSRPGTWHSLRRPSLEAD